MIEKHDQQAKIITFEIISPMGWEAIHMQSVTVKYWELGNIKLKKTASIVADENFRKSDFKGFTRLVATPPPEFRNCIFNRWSVCLYLCKWFTLYLIYMFCCSLNSKITFLTVGQSVYLSVCLLLMIKTQKVNYSRNFKFAILHLHHMQTLFKTFYKNWTKWILT